MKKLLIASCIGLVAAVFFSSFNAFAKECEEIRSSVLRLHVLANSDSEQDQQLKLRVRDKILALDTQLFGGAEDLVSAERLAEGSLDRIKEAALEEIHHAGYDYSVSVEMVNMYFTTREYEQFVLPAGNYDALRILIGEGKGQNWWCVLYPPLCVPAATTKEEALEVLPDEQTEIITNKEKYEYKFAIVEFFEGLWNQWF